MSVRRKIIIYGGAFDPPHRGHFALIRAAIGQLRPARLYIVPVFRSPFKEPPSAPYRDRAAMLREGLAAEGLSGPPVRIHPFELRRGKVTYTWQTVSFFAALHPDDELYFLMGSDCVEAFHLWKHYRRILAGATLLVGRRAGYGFGNPARAPYVLLRGRFPEAASTALKAGLFAGRRPRGLLPATLERIGRKGLYLGALRRRLKRSMPPGRFAHSLAVAAFAAELAALHGTDPVKAALAGLLHDAARDLSPRSQLRLARMDRRPVPRLRDIVSNAPVLLHPHAGAALAARKFGVRDAAVLAAIREHTLGAVRPGPLSMILYVADLAAEGRDFPEAARVAALARRDLAAAYRQANYVKLKYVSGTGGWMHPGTERIWHTLRNREPGRS